MQKREILNNENKPHQKHKVVFITNKTLSDFNKTKYMGAPKNMFIMLSGAEKVVKEILETKLKLKPIHELVYFTDKDINDVKTTLETYENEHVVKCAMFPRKEIEPPQPHQLLNDTKRSKATLVIDTSKTKLTDDMKNVLNKLGIKIVGTSASDEVIAKLKVPRVDTNKSIFNLDDFKDINVQITAHNVDEVARVAKLLNVMLLKFKHEKPYFTGAGHFY